MEYSRIPTLIATDLAKSQIYNQYLLDTENLRK